MGWGFRRGVRVGPFRLNVSKRGLSMSAGVRGARVNLSSRGLGVSGSALGFTYRKQLISKRDLERAAHEQVEQPISPQDLVDVPEQGQHAELVGFQRRRRAWPAVAAAVLLLASFALVTMRETRAPPAPAPAATPVREVPAQPPLQNTEPPTVAPARVAKLHRATEPQTRCGSPDAIDVVRKLSRWGDYSCKTRKQASALWSDCLDRNMYSLTVTGGCPGRQKCCPPVTQP